MADLIWLIPAFPAIGFLINGLLGIRFPKTLTAWVACLSVIASFAVSATIFVQFLQMAPESRVFEKTVFDWIVSGDFKTTIGFRIDALSIIMCLIVSGVGSLIHIYSVGYMHDDPGFRRYFCYLNLFVFMMLTLVTGDNVLLMFVGWEGVGLCSYLLIGFWYEKDSAANAGKKAFIVNRIGDFGFLLGLFTLVGYLGSQGIWTLKFSELQANVHLIGPGLATIITLLFFVGATGKSAQIPLYVWLPDAMEGPTPVSSLIHAATMVTAGVYMIARLNFLYVLAPTTLLVVTIVGLATAFFAATIGTAQYDIKRVLAYSTVSQLGYMFVGVGAGAYAAGIFHLMTHAFFKGLLFLAAGSVMHAMSGELDMRKMGGLRKKTPVTYWTTFIACLAIAGVPGFSGFFSKDEILWMAFSKYDSIWFWFIGVITAGMTAFYMFRMFFSTFHGECRADEEIKHHIHESPRIMTVPLMILAVLSLIGGYVGVPALLGGSNHIEKWLEPVFGHHAAPATAHAGGFNIISTAFASSGGTEGAGHAIEMQLMIGAVIIGLLGIFIAWLFYVKNPNLPKKFVEKFHGLFTLVHNKYFIDELYGFIFVRGLFKLGRFCKDFFDEMIIDGIVNGIASLLAGVGGIIRKVQTGMVQGYAFAVILGAIVVIGYLISRIL
ncbi:MAG: NADH-quinone oxidoreductase subunit L [Syntrophorhabdaceae bacterium]|nr:NADH-quinone oxidoreductase subunit L [Syntrophorhabdaceae bacterium]MDD4197189.1 NADH-quinone oxidoreductase subunit L [Syntrophorhabdaceae bacterium]